MKKILLPFLSVVMIFLVFNVSAKTYSKAQLIRMVKAGKYPKQGSPKITTKNINFNSCKQIVDTMLSNTEGYPTENVVNTDILIMKKIWANDGAIVISCSAPDQKGVVSVSPYL